MLTKWTTSTNIVVTHAIDSVFRFESLGTDLQQISLLLRHNFEWLLLWAHVYTHTGLSSFLAEGSPTSEGVHASKNSYWAQACKGIFSINHWYWLIYNFHEDYQGPTTGFCWCKTFFSGILSFWLSQILNVAIITNSAIRWINF